MKSWTAQALLAITIGMTIGSAAGAQQKKPISFDWLPPYKLGVTIGLNASNFSHEGFDPKCGFHLGVETMVDMSKFIDNTFVRTGILFSRKGAREDYTAGSKIVGMEGNVYRHEATHRTCYIEIPVRYGYGYVLDEDWVFYGELGPYFALGLGGRSHIDDTYGGGTCYSRSDDFFDDAKRFDFGLGFHAGVIFQKHHQLSLGYDFGYINMTDATSQNRNFMASYTYYFL